LGIIDEREEILNQWQPHPPPQQPPPPENDVEDLAEVPLLEPFEVAKTESWSEAFLLAHFGQAISCCLFNTSFSNSVWQSSQTYS
jgi:hypothetical protein